MGVMKTIEEARANFEAATTVIPERYRMGVSKADWASRAASDQAEANFNAAMSEALSKKSRQAGVKKVSNEEWRSAAMEKGGAVIGTRIRESLAKWQEKFGPIYSAVQAEVGRLPAPTVDPMSNIDLRLKPVVRAWRKHAGKG